MRNELTTNFFAAMRNQMRLQQERLNLKYLCYISQRAREQQIMQSQKVIQTQPKSTMDSSQSPRLEIPLSTDLRNPSETNTTVQMNSKRNEKPPISDAIHHEEEDSGFQTQRLSERSNQKLKTLNNSIGKIPKNKKGHRPSRKISNQPEIEENKSEINLKQEFAIEPWKANEDSSFDHSVLRD